MGRNKSSTDPTLALTRTPTADHTPAHASDHSWLQPQTCSRSNRRSRIDRHFSLTFHSAVVLTVGFHTLRSSFSQTGRFSLFSPANRMPAKDSLIASAKRTSLSDPRFREFVAEFIGVFTLLVSTRRLDRMIGPLSTSLKKGPTT